MVAGFDQIFLDMVECIETEQDRKDVIIELQAFVVSMLRIPRFYALI